MTIPPHLLSEGTFTVNCALLDIYTAETHGFEPDALAFQAVEGDIAEGVRGGCLGHWLGIVRPKLDWVTRPAEAAPPGR